MLGRTMLGNSQLIKLLNFNIKYDKNVPLYLAPHRPHLVELQEYDLALTTAEMSSLSVQHLDEQHGRLEITKHCKP